jgi:hypothetical protein
MWRSKKDNGRVSHFKVYPKESYDIPSRSRLSDALGNVSDAKEAELLVEELKNAFDHATSIEEQLRLKRSLVSAANRTNDLDVQKVFREAYEGMEITKREPKSLPSKIGSDEFDHGEYDEVAEAEIEERNAEIETDAST